MAEKISVTDELPANAVEKVSKEDPEVETLKKEVSKLKRFATRFDFIKKGIDYWYLKFHLAKYHLSFARRFPQTTRRIEAVQQTAENLSFGLLVIALIFFLNMWIGLGFKETLDDDEFVSWLGFLMVTSPVIAVDIYIARKLFFIGQRVYQRVISDEDDT